MGEFYMFPYSEIEKGKRVVIYGAGKIGQEYIAQLRENKYCPISFVIDENAEKKSEIYGIEIKKPSILSKRTDYDVIVLATMMEAFRNEMLKNLKDMHIDEAKVVWKITPVIQKDVSYSQHGEDRIIYYAFLHMGFFKDGKMPKLGSLEYLLKAANLVTGGITGVSVNGIIDLITPLKTGNFSQISGDIKVENGVANDINVYSQGKELNMYMTGNYNLSTLVADMEVYGSLSKNFSTLLGRIGNASLNRLLNRIPGININDINPESTSNINKIPNFNKENAVRVFKADIFGDINGSNYVKSFKWIKH